MLWLKIVSAWIILKTVIENPFIGTMPGKLWMKIPPFVSVIDLRLPYVKMILRSYEPL